MGWYKGRLSPFIRDAMKINDATLLTVSLLPITVVSQRWLTNQNIAGTIPFPLWSGKC